MIIITDHLIKGRQPDLVINNKKDLKNRELTEL